MWVPRGGGRGRVFGVRGAPGIIPPLFNLRATRRFMFRAISQIGITYRDSALSVGRAGDVRGGDRLPWVQPDAEGAPDNFTPLESLSWQAHVYGNASAVIRDACASDGLSLHELEWSAN